jgi:hypothetical protein
MNSEDIDYHVDLTELYTENGQQQHEAEKWLSHVSYEGKKMGHIQNVMHLCRNISKIKISHKL